MIEKVVTKRRLDDFSSIKADYSYWMTKTAEERVEAVELLRRQYHGDSVRLQRSARVVQLVINKRSVGRKKDLADLEALSEE
jgi:hypothetical protein